MNWKNILVWCRDAILASLECFLWELAMQKTERKGPRHKYCVYGFLKEYIYLAMYFIRKATFDDVEVIREIAEKTWREAYANILAKEQLDYMLAEIYSVEKISSQLKHETQTYLLLIEPAKTEGGNDKAVAFAHFSPREEQPEIYKLHKLYCLPETQGKGYGKTLINEVIDRTLEVGIHILDLNVNRYNKAKTFYEKIGFVAVYEEDIPIGNYWMNDFVMRKEL
jgi:GNAT superfamily N-acetyltransferase